MIFEPFEKKALAKFLSDGFEENRAWRGGG